jgi:peptidoglycan/xylan/chitin deacetylase (PgdA/CDA1 family)
MNAPSNPARWPAGIIDRVEDKPGMVALTFDDGPNVTATAHVREVLNSYDARATFFTVGKALDIEPGLSRDLLRDGHVLADHSYSHSLAGWLKPDDDELATSETAFARHLAVRPAYFRPPFGLVTRETLRQLEGRGMTCVTWDVAVGDWKLDDAQEIARRVLDAIRPGSIVLLHDGHEGDVTGDRQAIVDALPVILEGLKQNSLQPVGLDVLLERAPYLA